MLLCAVMLAAGAWTTPLRATTSSGMHVDQSCCKVTAHVHLVFPAAGDCVRWGLDHPAQGNYQQRLAQVRLLGEAYNYMLLDSR
jgi:hypothetical protein